MWLCLHFPQLPLEIFLRADIDQTPRAISTASTNREWVLACNREALACGVRPGMTISAAYALNAKLDVRSRNEAAEKEGLEHIAGWAGQFTSMVSLALPDGVILEVGGSLQLFGGLKNLLVRLKRGLEELGYETCLAVAPTPLGATLLARNGFEEPVTDLHKLHSRLTPLPVRSLGLDEETLEKMEGLGLDCIADCLRLPRDGFARRFGRELLLALDRALGKTPDPRRPFVSPPRFASRLLLPAQVENCAALLFAVRRLILELAGFLEARSSGIQALSLEMRHHNRPPTELTLSLVVPSRDPQHLQELLRARLERLRLREPVQEIQLIADEIRPLPDRNQDLFLKRKLPQMDTSAKAGLSTIDSLTSQYLLIEHLRARLGNDAVRGICLVPEHRPERTYRTCAPGASGPRPDFGMRPLWLLVEPLPLKAVKGRPWLQGPLSLRAGPERIESGWWDGQDVARDYFVAKNPKGSQFWIFRECRKISDWFLHGIFA